MTICRAQISKVCNLIPRIGIKKVFLLALAILILTKLYVYGREWMRTAERKKLQIPPDRLNYFMDNKDFTNLEYVINTGKCKIMKFSPWDSVIQQFLNKNMKPIDCSKNNNSNSTGWAYQDGTKIVLNETAVTNAGHSLSSLNCCYRGIVRQKQLSYMFGSRNADRQVEYTSPCVKMDLVTTPEYEFVRVTCSSPWLVYWEQVVYSDSFFIPMLETKIPEKTREFWLHKRDEMPPSVVLIGLDALSRMNYYRFLPQTKEFMDSHGAVELMGYTKVGENTFPNAVAFLSGLDLSDPDVPYECIRNPYKVPHDDCPYIWKRFQAANYVTALVEDYPGLMIFNHMKLGFVNQPTDFYFRPFLLSVDQPDVSCVGRFTTEETLLSYIRGVMSHSSNVPVFLHSWFTTIGHDDSNKVQLMDQTLANFLSSVNLSNTILVILSDHGNRYNAMRKTLPGWYEDKLPIVSIYLPPGAKAKFPEWEDTLKTNAQRLSSPYDLYQTLGHIITSYTTEDQSLPLFSKGQSLLTPISPNRTCSDARITVNFCACIPPKKVDTSDPSIHLAAEEAVKYLNSVLPSQCARAELDTVIAGAVMLEDSDNVKDKANGTFIITFFTNPGQFLFEATVDFTKTMTGPKDHYSFAVTPDLLRMNKIVRSADCVDTSVLERYCYCK